MSKPLTWRMSGDAGDSAFSLALMHHLGGKHIVRCVDRPGITAAWVPRVPLIRELFEAQPYIESVEISEEKPDIDLVGFRRWHSATTPLISAMASEYNMQVSKSIHVDGSVPWMKVEPDKSFEGKILIARSPRYNNARFPWRQIVEHYGSRLIFVGLENEHTEFCLAFGRVVHLRTKTLMEVAQAIAGSGWFMGNQSSPHAIALALGVNIISEVSTEQPDCIYPRQNVSYVCDGEVTLPDIAGSGTLYCPKIPDVPASFNTSLVPPGMWQYHGLPPCNHFNLQRGMVEQLEKCHPSEAETKLFHANALRCPSFFLGTIDDPMLNFRQAFANAFPQAPNTTSP